jgi:hypothetical protein
MPSAYIFDMSEFSNQGELGFTIISQLDASRVDLPLSPTRQPSVRFDPADITRQPELVSESLDRVYLDTLFYQHKLVQQALQARTSGDSLHSDRPTVRRSVLGKLRGAIKLAFVHTTPAHPLHSVADAGRIPLVDAFESFKITLESKVLVHSYRAQVVKQRNDDASNLLEALQTVRTPNSR